ncbi:MAG TPA: hypothetical protein VMM58_05475, partial [Bacteroidota bacterium]|nr:hypothetical protein [Bacteroidota bacterium]
MRRIFCALVILAGSMSLAMGQTTDSVDVTFYYATSSNLTAVFLPGEFDNWGNNTGGVIPSNDPSKMSKDPTTGVWWKTVRLHVGGKTGGEIPGAYQYKINENGSSSGWLPDPLNPRENTADNSNSILYVNNPTIFHLLPNEKSPIINQQHPTFSAYVYPSLASVIDSTSMAIWIDTTLYSIPPSGFNQSTRLVTF